MEKRWALVTGGTKGIGWSIARQLISQGVNVILTSRHIEDLKARQTELATDFPSSNCLVCEADLSNRNGVSILAKFVKNSLDTLDILVNNAGVFLPGSVIEEEEGALEKQIETNLYSAYYLTRELMPLIQKANRGYILNMCSIASFMAYPNAGSYTISKFAMLGWTKVLRSELLNSHIAVTAIMPGATWSASWAGAENDFPRERLIEAENIAQLVWSIVNLAPNAVVEQLVIRPQQGDL